MAKSAPSALLTLWETRAARALHAVGLDNVRTTIIILAVLASLIPALATGWISYVQNRRAIQDKLTEQLSSLSAQSAREMDLWLKEQVYNLRVFAASDEVTENIARGPQRTGRLPNYLRSVRERFADFDELLAVSADGRPVASSERTAGHLHFTGDWLAPARSRDPVLGEPFVEGAATEMEVAVPVVGANGRFRGALVARMNFRDAKQRLDALVTSHMVQLALLAKDGRVIAATGVVAPSIPAQVVRRLERSEGVPVAFTDPNGTGEIGILAPIQRTGWAALADVPQQAAFAQITRLRNTTALLVLVLLVGVGSLAYALGLLIVRPIARLSGAAQLVAGGDLDVEVPLIGVAELSRLTRIFNDMVKRLRNSRVELEHLSVTDPLTGLANRRRLMVELEREVRRSDRLGRKFVVAMLDVDHFKKYNDSYGHLAGDEVLKRLAMLMFELVREVDTPARFGGEEFLVILTETPIAEAQRVAERLRERLAQEKFAPTEGAATVGVTVSIGLAEFPADGTTSEALIAAADKALYQAKESGRNRVVVVKSLKPARKSGKA